MTVKVGVIGLGFMGSAHARVYKKLRNSQLIAICDSDPQKKQVAEDYSCNFYVDLKEFFKEDLDAVSVCTPTSMHKEVVISTLENGLHALVEKPFSDSLQNGKKMIRKAEKTGRLLAVGYIERFNSAVRKLSKVVNFSNIFSTVSMRFALT